VKALTNISSKESIKKSSEILLESIQKIESTEPMCEVVG
jgi:hypothetical protein